MIDQNVNEITQQQQRYTKAQLKQVQNAPRIKEFIKDIRTYMTSKAARGVATVNALTGKGNLFDRYDKALDTNKNSEIISKIKKK